MFQPEELAKIVLEIGAIKFNPEQPFTWASGYRMPIYNDNRLLLDSVDHRLRVAEGFRSVLKSSAAKVDVVAGTATAGIAPATSLANLLETPLIYVRSAPKGHGMQNQVEGLLKNKQSVVVIEDLISTGKSALQAVEAVRKAGGLVEHCLCIFSYGFPTANDLFNKSDCRLHSLLTFETLLNCALGTKTLNPETIEVLRSWHKDPFSWGEKRGFPRLGS